jgi:hypothetical protein
MPRVPFSPGAWLLVRSSRSGDAPPRTVPSAAAEDGAGRGDAAKSYGATHIAIVTPSISSG